MAESSSPSSATLHEAELGAARPGRRRLRRVLLGVAVAVALLVVYYVVGALWVHEIDDDPDFAVESTAPEGGSRAVALAADLIEREVDHNSWVANDPFFMPGSLLDNMPNFQQGVVAALSRFTLELTDQIARTRGSSQVDPDLERAAGLLRYAGDVWIFDLSTSLAPTASSESQYRRAMRSLRDYNARLAAGNAVFEPRADNLMAVMERMAADLGSASAALEGRLEERPWFVDTQADDLFYRNKGRLYGYYLILRELGQDFAAVVRERQLEAVWAQMLDSLRDAATLQPLVVVNGNPEGQFTPSHLASQGFYLLRARTQLREITNILLK
jgi:hypothetical protein